MEYFEAIVENLVMQQGFTRLEVIGDDVTVVGERVSGSSELKTGKLSSLFKGQIPLQRQVHIARS